MVNLSCLLHSLLTWEATTVQHLKRLMLALTWAWHRHRSRQISFHQTRTITEGDRPLFQAQIPDTADKGRARRMISSDLGSNIDNMDVARIVTNRNFNAPRIK